jgi:xylulokinase
VEEPYILGIDLGTSSVKVVLTDEVGGVRARSTRAYDVSRPSPGRAEADPDAWWRAVVDAVREALRRGKDARVAAVGLAGQMHGVVLADSSGRPVRPAVLWEDARAVSELDRYRALQPDVLERLANPLTPGMAGPILGWTAVHEPDVIARADVALQPKDWVRGRLTGEWDTEPSDASATLLYDVLARDWSRGVLSGLGIPSGLLPRILAHSGAVGGSLTNEAAEALRLTPGIPVAAGAADTAAAALGSGLLDRGQVQLTIGTGVQVVSPVPAPRSSTLPPAGRAVTHLYRSATSDGWYAMAAGLTGGATLSWVRRILGADWSELYRAADRGPHVGDPLFLPHLVGERTPYLDPSMRGGWIRLDAQHDREALLYSAVEGVAFAVAGALDAMPVPDHERETLRIAGGGTTSGPWRRLLADVLHADLYAVETPDASARGAALLGSRAGGLLDGAALREAARPATSLVASPSSRAGLLDRRREDWLESVALLHTRRVGDAHPSSAATNPHSPVLPPDPLT